MPAENSYRELMRTPGAWPIAIASLVARIPNAMAGVALVLFLHEETGSFASAGLVTGAMVLGMGGTGPFLARLIDHRGARVVLLAGGLLAAAALVAIFALGRAGGAMPPIGSVSRRRWGGLVSAERLPTAYAVEAILLETIFIAGPALAGLLAGVFDAGDALLVAAAIGIVGSVWISTLVASVGGPDDPAGAGARERHWAGALRFPLVRLLIATGLLMGASIGAMEIAMPAFGAAHGNARSVVPTRRRWASARSSAARSMEPAREPSARPAAPSSRSPSRRASPPWRSWRSVASARCSRPPSSPAPSGRR